ncbi:MAG: hypothetical protein C3F15_15785 [Holophagae bacterium]|nr:MAG: hypothetical protein C3F15_15785 [Holophagae bacterium]
MKLTASTQAVRGPHSVRLKAGTQIIDLPLQVQVLHPEQAAPLNAATPRAAAAERGAVQQSAADQRQQARPSSAARPPVTGVSQQPAKSSSRNILTAANDNLVVIIPHLVVQTGTKEFESYATALGFASPEKLTFQWSHSNPEVKSGQWEVTHDNFVVMKGSAGAAPPPGQVKNFDIDFRGFVNLPAPGDPVRYRVRVRGMKALIPESETSIRAARVDEPVAATASSPAAATVDDESLFVTPLSNAVVITYASQVDSVFTEEGLELPWPERDDDHDGFKNGEEDALAAQFRPYFIFDAEESDRRQGEPVVIYQVQCVGRAEWCTTAHIRYYFLFREDGGWQSCSPWCNNAHNGDNQAFDIDVLRHAAEPDDPYTYWYMVWGADRFQYTHPILYLAAGKHHNYLSTSWNHVDDGGCCDDVAGDGDQIFPDVVTDGRYHNVGERNAPLIDDLGFLGYPGECAWCGKAFRGGLEDDEGDSEPFEWF